MVVHKEKYNKKFIHTQNHLNEQVVIELVFYNFFHMKKASGYQIIKLCLITNKIEIINLCEIIELRTVFTSID